MKKNVINWLIAITIVIVISNLLPLSFFFPNDYSYQNLDGSFHYTEHADKGLDFEVGKIRYKRFLTENPSEEDVQLYRKFHFKPWRFWEWSEAIRNNERFTLPVLPTKE